MAKKSNKSSTIPLKTVLKKFESQEKGGKLNSTIIDELIFVADKNCNKYPNEAIKLYLIAYRYYKSETKHKEFEKLSKKLIPILKKENDQNKIGQVYLDLGIDKRIAGRYNESLDALTKAKEIFERNNNTLMVCATHNSIANYYLEKGNLNFAFENYYKAFDNLKQYPNKEIYHIVKHNLAHLYMVLNNYKKAKELYTQDLDLLKNSKARDRYAASLQGIAEVYLEEERYKLAYKYILQSLKEWDKTQNKRGQASSLVSYGNVLRGFKKYKDAISSFKKAKKLLHQLSYKNELIKLHLYLGNTYYDAEEYEKSIEQLELAEEIAIEYKLNFELRRIHNSQYSSLLKLNDNKKLFEVLKKIKALNDNYFNSSIQAKVNEQLIGYELEKKELEFKKEREINEFKSNLFSYLTHEFRTPLTLINTPLQLIQQEDDIYKIKEKIPAITAQIDHLNDLINQLLDLNKIESGHLPIIKKVGSINSLIWHIIHIYEPEMHDKSIDFSYSIPNKNIFGSFDGDKIQKIITNLLSNSLKYTKSGGRIKLEVEVEESELSIVVKDTGIGIDKKFHNDIFNKFYRISDKHDAKGSGLGLSFVKELVDLLGGKIELDSKVNTGSKFLVKIPFQEIHDYKASLSLENESENEDSKKSGQTILIVEDNPEIQKLIKEVFVDKYKIVSADNGKTAVQKIEKRVPDLIITDLMMPIMNGIELTTKIKNDTNLNHIPIIILSAKNQSEDKIKAIESGADIYISKPFDIQVLKHTVENTLKQRKTIVNKFSKNTFNLEEEELVSADVVFINTATEFVLENIANEDMSVNDLAKHMNMSRFTLIRKFNKIGDLTPNNYIQKIRLEKAKEYLKNRVANISEIAYKVGFRSTTYFSYSFKKEYGISPKEYYKNPFD